MNNIEKIPLHEFNNSPFYEDCEVGDCMLHYRDTTNNKQYGRDNLYPYVITKIEVGRKFVKIESERVQDE